MKSFRFVLGCWTLAIFLLPLLWFGPTIAFGGRDRYFFDTLLFIWAYASVFGLPVLGSAWALFAVLQQQQLPPLARYGIWTACILLLIFLILWFGFAGPNGMQLHRFCPVFLAAFLSLLFLLPLYLKLFTSKNQ
ncbi:MAG: hypothetical protein EOO11_17385 [Chitinophagaceae bacterium]|nr:MAG: hypothetical protein EOO11_17385 [Chitinophagaceae bacterium]